MKPASGLAPSQSRKGHTKHLPKQSQDQYSTVALLWLLLLIMNKFLEFSRDYGYPDVLISFCWHSLNFQRACLPEMVSSSSDLKLCHYYYYSNMAANRKPHGKQCNSSQRAQRIIYGNVYLCNIHNFTCDQRAGTPSPTTQCGYLQPAEAIIMTILHWECLKGGWCQAHTMLSSSHGWQEGHNLSPTHLA